MNPAATLDIIVVNWNAGALLRACLESIAMAQPVDLQLGKIIVVDNASTDRSLEGIDRIHPLIELIRNTTNTGFAVACNQGAGRCSARYLLFLNPDTRIDSGSLRLPVSFMEDPANESVGICGIRLLDVQGRAGRTCSRFPTSATFLYKTAGLDIVLPTLFRGYAMTEWDHARSAFVDHVMGAFYLVRRTVFEQLGGFDERFFVYLEDLDFSLRARRAGWRTYYLADTCAYHEGGGSSSKVKASRLFFSLRSRIQYAFKHFGRAPAFAILISTATVEPLCRLARALLRGSAQEVSDTLGGYWMFWKYLPRLLAVAKT